MPSNEFISQTSVSGRKLKVDLYHNIMWSKYKAVIFSELHEIAQRNELEINFYQIAETEQSRKSLSTTGIEWHKYPVTLLYKGVYNDIPKIGLFLRLFFLVLRSRADVVLIPGYHAAEYWGMLFACMLGGKRRAVFCDSTVNDRPQRRVAGWLKSAFFRACNGFFAYGSRSAEYLKMYGAPENRIFAHCQAAAPISNKSQEEILQQRASRSLVGPTQILYVGRLAEEKGLKDLLMAVNLVKSGGKVFQLKIVGEGDDKLKLIEMVRSLDLDAAVTFCGAKEAHALAEFYLNSDIFILPSYSEPWGLVVNEALSLGCPVIVSNICGCVPELIAQGKSGFSYPSGDVNELASRIVQLMDIIQKNPLYISKSCLQVIKEYSPKEAAQRISAGIRTILS